MIAAAGIHYDHVTTRLDHEGMKTHFKTTISRQLSRFEFALAGGQHLRRQVREEVARRSIGELKIDYPFDCKCTQSRRCQCTIPAIFQNILVLTVTQGMLTSTGINLLS
jgi:hypothetical protein